MATDWSAVAAKRIRKPGARPPRVLVYGRNKVGKTTFAASGPNTLVIDPEGGAEHLGEGVDLWPITGWKDLTEVFNFLRSGNHSYEWVAIDGLTRISNMSLRYVMKQQEERDLDRIPGFVQQRDYGKAGELMKGLMFNFQHLPLGIIYSAQDRMESSTDFQAEDEDVEDAEIRFVPDLPKGVRSTVNSIVDVIGRLYVANDTVVVKGEEKQVKRRRLWLAPSEMYDTGARSTARLPQYLQQPTVPRLVQLLEGKGTK